MVFSKGTLDFREEVIFYEVILDKAHVKNYVYRPAMQQCPIRGIVGILGTCSRKFNHVLLFKPGCCWIPTTFSSPG